jgi:DNA-binding response OmpR family regulator
MQCGENVLFLRFQLCEIGCGSRRARMDIVKGNDKRRDQEPMSQTRHILVVDDDKDLREALCEQLALHPEFEVAQVDSARRAMDAVAAAQPDLVIMDVGLPDLDGREAVARLRADGFKRPVIMLTGRDSDADAIMGLDSGANDYVVKPFDPSDLCARVEKMITASRKQGDYVGRR